MIPLLLVPGIGADHRQFIEQRRRFPQLIVPDWPLEAELAGHHETGMDSYARRCWDAWTTDSPATIPANDPYFLGGASYGGMLALELAWFAASVGKPPLGVLLLGSCRSWDAVPAWYGRWARWSTRLPIWLSKKLFFNRHIAALSSSPRPTADSQRLIGAMLQASDWPQLRRFAGHMAGWRRDTVETARAPFAIHQLHGRADTILSVPSPQVATLLLDAGYWLTITHANAVNRWIEAILSDASLRHRHSR